MAEIKLQTIRKLLLSSSEDDVILGIEYLHKKYYSKNRSRLFKILKELDNKFDYDLMLDFYTDKHNIFLEGGFIYIYEGDMPPAQGARVINLET